MLKIREDLYVNLQHVKCIRFPSGNLTPGTQDMVTTKITYTDEKEIMVMLSIPEHTALLDRLEDYYG